MGVGSIMSHNSEFHTSSTTRRPDASHADDGVVRPESALVVCPSVGRSGRSVREVVNPGCARARARRGSKTRG